MNNILAGIVLYNPQIERLILELKSIEKQVQKICMFDNGSNNYSEIEKVMYYGMTDEQISYVIDVINKY